MGFDTSWWKRKGYELDPQEVIVAEGSLQQPRKGGLPAGPPKENAWKEHSFRLPEFLKGMTPKPPNFADQLIWACFFFGGPPNDGFPAFVLLKQHEKGVNPHLQTFWFLPENRW